MSSRSGPVQSGLSLTDYQIYYPNTTVIINKYVINHVLIKRFNFPSGMNKVDLKEKFGRADWALFLYLLNVGPSISEAGCWPSDQQVRDLVLSSHIRSSNYGNVVMVITVSASTYQAFSIRMKLT